MSDPARSSELQSLDALETELRRRLSQVTGQSASNDNSSETPARSLGPAAERPRRLLALVGAPASGKTTLAAELERRLADVGPVVVPMDGFHLDNDLLDEAGLRPVKGAPQTFDVEGFDSLLARLVANRSDVLAPVFDRSADLARGSATRIATTHRTIIVEGNYLLLDRPGWRELKRHFDSTVMIDVSEQELRERLIQRWLDHGLSREAAIERAESNDLPNGRVVLHESMSADIRFRSVF